MLNIKKEHKIYLKKNGIDISGYSTIEDLPDLLEAIDDAIVENIVNNDDEPDAIGIRLQKIYDEIRADNIYEYEHHNE